MASKELKMRGTYGVYITPHLVTYNLNTRESRYKELMARLRKLDSLKGTQKVELKSVRRPLYGMQLMHIVDSRILKMAQTTVTDVYRDYLFIEIKKGCHLYIDEFEEGLQIFMVCEENGSGFEDFSAVI